MPLTDLTLDTLADLDNGKVALMFQRRLAEVIADVKDRPGDATARKVSLTLIIKPAAFEEGVLESMEIEAVVKASVPEMRTRPYECKNSPDGGLQFNADSPSDVNQLSIADELNRKANGA